MNALSRLCYLWAAITLTVCLSACARSPPSTVAAQSVKVSVPGTAHWTDTGVDVVKGELLTITATGLWTEGSTTNGPDGISKLWPDNFFNLKDIGNCNVCATQLTPHQHALIGYIGNSPPAPGSYTSSRVRPEAAKIFYVGSHFQEQAPLSGRLWLNKNTDAYSNYTADNRGTVMASVMTTLVAPVPEPVPTPAGTPLSVALSPEQQKQLHDLIDNAKRAGKAVSCTLYIGKQIVYPLIWIAGFYFVPTQAATWPVPGPPQVYLGQCDSVAQKDLPDRKNLKTVKPNFIPTPVPTPTPRSR